MSVRYLLAAVVVTAMTLTACTSSSENTSGAMSSNPNSDTNAGPTGELAFGEETGTTAAGGSDTDGVSTLDIEDYDLVVFIAAGERMLAGGPYEGAIYESPELYVAAAESFCRRFDDGASVNLVVADFAADAGFDLTSMDDRTLIGSVLGAGVESMCPRHRDLL